MAHSFGLSIIISDYANNSEQNEIIWKIKSGVIVELSHKLKKVIII